MKPHLVFLLLLLPIFSFSQKNVDAKTISKQEAKEIKEIKKFQKELNEEYLNPKETPLRGDNFTHFKKHPFFPIDLKYRVR
ncbi:MAG: hypothetical protein DI622_22995, partial [Chryseobacterium sp.]